MRQIIAWMLALVALAGCLAGCDQDKNTVEAEPSQEAALPDFPESQVPPPEPQPTGATESTEPAPPVDTTARTGNRVRQLPKDNYAQERPAGTGTYVIQKGDTLYKISRKLYGTPTRWREIYQANRNVLTQGPDHLPEGVELKIP
jgi:nucleoid-associated protein YgaU